MSQDEAIHCPKCKQPVLEANYEAHLKSGHKEYIIKLDKEEHKKPGNPISAEVSEMIKAYPRAWFLTIFIAFMAGVTMEYYYLVR